MIKQGLLTIYMMILRQKSHKKSEVMTHLSRMALLPWGRSWLMRPMQSVSPSHGKVIRIVLGNIEYTVFGDFHVFMDGIHRKLVMHPDSFLRSKK